MMQFRSSIFCTPVFLFALIRIAQPVIIDNEVACTARKCLWTRIAAFLLMDIQALKLARVAAAGPGYVSSSHTVGYICEAQAVVEWPACRFPPFGDKICILVLLNHIVKGLFFLVLQLLQPGDLGAFAAQLGQACYSRSCLSSWSGSASPRVGHCFLLVKQRTVSS